MNADSVIQGIGGSFFAPKTVLPTGYNPNFVFIAYGTNDFMRLKTLEDLETKAREYVSNVKEVYKSAEIFVITPVWRKDEDAPREMGTFKKCCDCIKKVAEELAVEIIDGDKLIPHFSEFMADTVHPNDLGFSMYAINVLKQLKGKI